MSAAEAATASAAAGASATTAGTTAPSYFYFSLRTQASGGDVGKLVPISNYSYDITGAALMAVGGLGLAINKAAIVAIGSAAVVPYSLGTAAAKTIVDVEKNDFLRWMRSNKIICGRRRICDGGRRRLRQRNDRRRRSWGRNDRNRFLVCNQGCREFRCCCRHRGRVV